MDDDWKNKAIVIFTIDLEHGGSKCEIVQLSSVTLDPFMKIHPGEFDSYVQPDANASWNEEAMYSLGSRRHLLS